MFKIKNKQNIGFIVLVLLVSGACLWAFISAGMITEGFKKRLADESLGKQEVTIQNLLVTETKEGIKSWEMYAEQGYYDNTNKVAVLFDIVGNFYKENEVVASFKSARGTYNEVKKEIILYEDSLIVYKDGSNVSANQMSWAGKGTDIYANGNVRMELPENAVVYGEKAVLNSEYNNLEVLGRTKTEIYDKGNVKI